MTEEEKKMSEREHEKLRADKEYCRKIGYGFQISVYVGDDDGKEQGCRMEVFFRNPPSPVEIEIVKTHLSQMVPKSVISVFIYDEKKDRLIPARMLRIMEEIGDDYLGGSIILGWL